MQNNKKQLIIKKSSEIKTAKENDKSLSAMIITRSRLVLRYIN